MARLLLRLLLIVSLVANGVAAPWAMAATPHGGHAGHAGHTGESRGAPHAHHGEHAHHETPAPPLPADDDGSCCDGPDCQCGCVLPPMLSRPAAAALAFAWSLPPASEPTVRARVRNAIPPFRPPAA